MLARTQTLEVYDHQGHMTPHIAAANEWIQPGQELTLSEAEYATAPALFLRLEETPITPSGHRRPQK